jgi:glycosyltransferase involved in cell wall biosynthesis
VRHVRLTRRIRPLANLRALLEVRRLLRAQPFDVVCTSCSLAGFVGRVAAALARVPARIHILQVYASRPHQPAPRRAFYRWIERRLDPLTTRSVAVSEAGKRYGVDTGIMSAERVEVIFNAAELPPPRPGARADLRRELGLEPEAEVIGTLGRLEPQKGVEHLLRAMVRVLDARPAARLVVVGDGPLRAELEALAARLGIARAVRFAGWRTDVPEVLSALDLFCLASLWESFGIVLAEAMLASLPIVATRVDGIPEVVCHGETGFLVAPGSDAELAERILALLSDAPLRRALGEAGRVRALERFSVRRMVAEYERFFRRVAAGSG